MNKKKIILVILLLFLLGCSDKNPHKGLYNALFMNYDERLSKLDQNLTEVKKDKVELEKQYQVVDNNVTEKELILNQYREMDEVSFEVDSLYEGEKDREKLDKIKKIIQKMKNTTIRN